MLVPVAVVQGAGATAPGYELSYVEFTGNVAVSATTIGTAHTVVTSSSISLDGSTAILIEFFTSQIQPGSTNASGIAIDLFEDATDLGLLTFVAAPTSSGGGSFPVLVGLRRVPSAGAHTYTVKTYRTNSNGTVVAGNGGVGNAVPGFIRVTRV